MKEGYRQTEAGWHSTVVEEKRESRCGYLPTEKEAPGAKQDYIATAWASKERPQGSSPGGWSCVSLRWRRTRDSIVCSWSDAGLPSSEIQVLEIRSMMKAGIRAASSLFG